MILPLQLIRVGQFYKLQVRGCAMVIEYISETSVRLKVENENNKITNKLKTIFMGGKTPPSK